MSNHPFLKKEESGAKTNVTKNSLVIFCSEVIIAVLIFLPQFILARKLGSEGVGVYSLFLAIIGTSVLLGNLGIGNASIYLTNREKKNPAQLFSNVLIFGTVWGIILAGLFYLISLIFPSLIFGFPQNYIFLAFLVIPVTLLHNYLLPFFIAKFQIFQWSALSILYNVLILLGIVISVIILDLGIAGVIYSIALSCIITLFFIFLYLLKLFPLKFYFNKRLFLKEIKFGLSSYLGNVFNGTKINFMLNVFIINIFLGMADIGYYSVAYSFAAILLFVPFSLQQVLYSKWSLSNREEIDRKTPKLGRQILILGFLAALFLALTGKQFIFLFYGKEFYSSISPFLLVLPGVVFIAFASIFFNNFFTKGKPHIASLILVTAIIINILLSIVLVPIIGIRGAAISTSISYFFAALLTIFFFSKITNYSIKEIVRVQVDDFRFLTIDFRHIPGFNLEKLKDYYEKKAIEGPTIINLTFKSPVLYKRISYATRVDKIMEMLNLCPKDKVLEVGCGEGYYTKQIGAITSNLIATDISQNYLIKAKSYNSHQINGYVCCPVEKLPFADNSFNKVLMSEVIEHLSDWEKGVKEIWRVLKPDGNLVVATPNKHSYLNFLCHLKTIIKNEPFTKEHIKEFSRKELESLLQKYFIIERFSYTNYFPVLLPGFLLKIVEFKTIKNIIQKVEKFLEKIPIIQGTALTMIAKVKKPNK